MRRPAPGSREGDILIADSTVSGKHAGIKVDEMKFELADFGFAYPNAASLVQLAHAQALREQWVKPWEITPLYLRKPDIDINWATRDSK